MNDEIERQAAYDTLTGYYHHTTEIQHKALREALERVPSAETHEKRTETHSCDLISRQAAIDALKEAFNPSITNFVKAKLAIENLPSAQPEKRTEERTETLELFGNSEQLPSAQPERTQERTETHACDLISRQVAIDALEKSRFPGAPYIDRGILIALREIKKLPSAQPEPCEDTIDALNESIKHFDDMAEECRRNANIERNDYMDMRDDAAEYRQLSIWLNELKWLRERFQSQPDLEEAYICGETEAEARFHAQQRWIPCSERLPEERQEILATTTDNAWGDVVIIRTYYKEMHKSVIAWMPLPEPYREEGNE